MEDYKSKAQGFFNTFRKNLGINKEEKQKVNSESILKKALETATNTLEKNILGLSRPFSNITDQNIALHKQVTKQKEIIKNQRLTLQSQELALHGIIHDLNLNRTLNFLKFALEEITPELRKLLPEDFEDNLLRTKGFLEKSKNILSNIRNLFKLGFGKASLELKEINIKEIVQKLKDIQTRANPTNKININISENLTTVKSSPIMIERILENLIKNAIQANAQNISIYGEDGVDSFGTKVYRIIVEDDGDPVEKKGQLFDAFKTTKEQGSGIGLASSRLLANTLEGSLIFKEEGNKKQFILAIPQSE